MTDEQKDKYKIKLYLEKKFEGYKQQNEKRKLKYNKNDYITAEWIKEEFSKLKSKCMYSTL